MFYWSRAVICVLLMCLMSYSSAHGQRGALSFSHSLRLTRIIRTHVQQLLSTYKQQVFGDERFENRELVLNTLPAVTVSYHTWIRMQDIDRLHLASRYLQTFWTHLEDQRQQLERERGEMKERRVQSRGRRGRPQPTLCESLKGLQIDLRDLMRQVNSQLVSLDNKQDPRSTTTKSPQHSTSGLTTSMHHSTVSTTVLSTRLLQTSSQADRSHSSTHLTPDSTQSSGTTEKTSSGPKSTQTSTTSDSRASKLSVDSQQTSALSSGSRWDQYMRGYVVLRDLERYLSRLARDYTVLQAKYR